MPPDRYALIRDGRAIWGPGPRPYVIELPEGERFEVAAHLPHEWEAAGLLAVEQRGWREIDSEIEQAASPEFYVEDGRPVETWSYVFTPGAREAMRRKIDEQAEALRGKFITAAPGQALEYAAVLAEARSVSALASEEPIVPGHYVFLEADLAVTDLPNAGRKVATIREAAAVALAAHERWRAAGAAIRARRLAAKSAVTSAATEEEAFRLYSRAWLGLF
jgi:hypothetical protein